MSELVPIFRDNTPQIIQAIGEAIEKHNALALAAQAHKLSSSLVTSETRRARTLALRLEKHGQESDFDSAEKRFTELERETDKIYAALSLISSASSPEPRGAAGKCFVERLVVSIVEAEGRNGRKSPCASFAGIVVLLVALPAHAGEVAITSAAEPYSFKPIASLTNFGLYESSPFFSADDKAWLETSLRFGGRFEYKNFAFEAVGIGVRTSGRDPYGSGNTPQFDFDTLYLQWNQTSGLPFKLTIGRQPIILGTQFLIGDGVYDGFHRNYTEAVYHNPRRSFDAARLEFDAATLHFDAFIYSVNPTWDGGGERDGWVGGMEVSRSFTKVKSSYAAGLFYRDSPSNLDNDMWLVTLRGEQRYPGLDDFYVSGEWDGEFGRGNNAAYVTTPNQNLNEHAWHAEVGWQADNLPLKPFAEAGYVYYSADFTPVATGFSDWGKWYLGNQIDWIVFGTNTRIIRAQAGFWPHKKVKLRAQYHQTRLVSGPNGPLSDEVSVIGEWFANDHLWVNALVGYSMPHGALAASGLTNPFSFLNADAVPVGNKASVDFVLAVGFNF